MAHEFIDRLSLREAIVRAARELEPNSTLWRNLRRWLRRKLADKA
jgi:hypothetical protein